MLKVNYEIKENIVRIKFRGELQIEEVEQLKTEFNQFKNNNKYFLFDLSEITLIDSSGLGYVVTCLKTARELDGDLKIIGLNNQAKLIFEITKVDSIIDIFEKESEAISSFEEMERSYESYNSNTIEISA